MQILLRHSRKGKTFLITDFDHFMREVTHLDTIIPSTQDEMDVIEGYALVMGSRVNVSLKVPTPRVDHIHVSINWGRPL